jgi:carbamoyltransferase
MNLSILGISGYFHDSSAALIVDDRVIACSEEERFTRIKHDNSFPLHAIDFCLSHAGLRPSEISYVAFYEKPYLKLDRIFEKIISEYPRTFQSFSQSMRNVGRKDLMIFNDLDKNFCIPNSKVRFLQHHFSHAAGAFFTSGFQESAILTVDGVGEFATMTISLGRAGKIEPCCEMGFPDSVGLLYSVFTAFCGFEVNEGEYKLMGMSSYGRPKFKAEIYKMVKIYEDGSILIDRDYINYHLNPSKPFSQKFVSVFGLPRDEQSDFNLKTNRSDQRFADVAASIQEVVEEIVLKMAIYARQITGCKNLCFSGGVALNGKANQRIRREAQFDGMFVQPAAGDSGTSLGAALGLASILTEPKCRPKVYSAYSGYSNDPGQVEAFFNVHERGRTKTFRKPDDLLKAVADKLSRGQVGGWVRGRAEFGPRALGNRSILADPSRSEMKDTVNAKIKFRELFRPFAPSALDFYASEAFEIGPLQLNDPLEYMLQVVKVKPDYQTKLPAITHIDGTARLQVVTKKRNPDYYSLIRAFGDLTGVYCLLNTSFNLKGEPIVNTHLDAYKTFLSCGLDFLVCENTLITKK